jgi:hypothetical protein
MMEVDPVDNCIRLCRGAGGGDMRQSGTKQVMEDLDARGHQPREVQEVKKGEGMK